MASTKILCRNTLDPLMESYGFTRHLPKPTFFWRSYYRQVNDVLQILTVLKKGNLYNIAFDIEPLSLGITHLIADRLDLAAKRDVWPEWIRRNTPWELRNYDKARGKWWVEKELVDTEFEEPISLIKEHVIPIFETGVTAKTAYQQLVIFEKSIKPTIWMNSTPRVLLCLQAGDYETAQRHMAAIYLQNGLEKSRLELERIKNRDTEYWNKVLEEGTKKTLDYLESIKPKRRLKY